MTRATHPQCFVVHRVERLPLDFRLPLGVFALVREQVGLDVGVGEAIPSVGDSEPPCSLHVDHQLRVFVLDAEHHLSGDVIVSLA